MSLFFNILNTLVIAVTALLLYLQVRAIHKQIDTGHQWNRRKTTQEMLHVMVMGEFPSIRHELEEAYGCIIWDKNQTYGDVVQAAPDKKDAVDYRLARIMNFFETIAINIKNDVIEEKICYDYLGWIYTEYYRWGKSFIEERRKRAGDPRVLIDFSDYAEKWSQQMIQERNNLLNHR
jgi:hypothetical protein